MNVKEYNTRYYKLHKDEINKKRNKGIQNTRELIPGEKFSNLTVVELYGKDKNGKIAYLCRCECGNTRIVRRSYLLLNRTKSCGCQRSIANSITGKRTIQFAIESKRHFEGNLSGSLWRRILANAKLRNIEVSISQKYAWELFLKQNKKCALTGLELYLDPHYKNRITVTASLDRINSSIGYVDGNVQWVHKIINKMKGNLSESEFKLMCKKVTNYDASTSN